MTSNPNAANTLIAALACCLSGLAVPAANAHATGDLECTRCVDRTDIAQDAITSGKLKNGAVREGKLGYDVRSRLDTIESRFESVSVAGAAFQPAMPTIMTEKTPAGVILPLQTDDVAITAGVELPQGMTLKDLSCTVRDASEPGIVVVSLRRFPLDAVAPDTAGEDVIQVTSSEVFPLADGFDPNNYRDVYSIAGSPGVAIVDNDNYHYFLYARMIDVGDDPSAMGLAGCSIGLGKYPF